MDVLTSEQRSYNMSRIRGRDTKPEEIVRKFLFSKGLRYRKNDKRYPGEPDIVLPRYRTVIFVNGCFWHRHEGCADFSLPKTNRAFWEDKLAANVRRDQQNKEKLSEMGWHVIVVWECELKKNVRLENLEQLYQNIVGTFLIE